MESRDLLIVVIFMCMFVAEIQVHGMSAVNTDFEQYLRSMNSSTTVPKIEERQENYIFAWLNYTYGEDKFKNFTEEKARYGEGQILSVQGLLVHVTNRDDPSDDRACSPEIMGTLGNPIPRHQAWIALVRRGVCNFEEKVKHVYQKGAVGVIVFNDKLVANLEKMQIRDKTRNITAVITYKDIGEEMASILDQGYEVVATITRGKSGVRPVNTLNKTSVLFVSISFIVLMIISLVWLIFYYIQRFRYLQSKDQQSRHLCSVTKRAIMKIPTKTGKSNDKDSDNDCCAICIEVYKSSDCIRVLPCNHEFHKTCIDPWLIEHRTCPMCKLDVLKYYGYVVGEPSTTISSSTNERIINPNVHIVIAPSSTNSSQFGGNDSSNHSTDSSGSNQPASVVMLGRASPATVDASPPSDSSLMLGDGVPTASTASRQVTDV